MDDLANAAGVARRTLYNQFSTKEEILRDVLQRTSQRLGDALPPGVETMGGVEEVLSRAARALATLHARPETIGLVRLVAGESRQFPWIGEAFRAIPTAYMERLTRLIAHWDSLGMIDCVDPELAARQFEALIGLHLWPRVLGDEVRLAPPDRVAQEAVRMFLSRYPAAVQARVSRSQG